MSTRKTAPRPTIRCGHAGRLRIPIAKPGTRACLEFTMHSSWSAASSLGQHRSSVNHDRTIKAVGNERKFKAAAGALSPNPSRPVGADIWTDQCMPGSPGGAARVGRQRRKPLVQTYRAVPCEWTSQKQFHIPSRLHRRVPCGFGSKQTKLQHRQLGLRRRLHATDTGALQQWRATQSSHRGATTATQDQLHHSGHDQNLAWQQQATPPQKTFSAFSVPNQLHNPRNGCRWTKLQRRNSRGPSADDNLNLCSPPVSFPNFMSPTPKYRPEAKPKPAVAGHDGEPRHIRGENSQKPLVCVTASPKARGKRKDSPPAFSAAPAHPTPPRERKGPHKTRPKRQRSTRRPRRRDKSRRGNEPMACSGMT